MFEIEAYTSEDGKQPFSEWLRGLRDTRARARIMSRLDRVSRGNFGDWKSLSGAEGIAELRDPYGPGYRVYYSLVGNRVVLLLAGSTKRDQARTIAKARDYLADYIRRNSQ